MVGGKMVRTTIVNGSEIRRLPVEGLVVEIPLFTRVLDIPGGAEISQVAGFERWNMICSFSNRSALVKSPTFCNCWPHQPHTTYHTKLPSSPKTFHTWVKQFWLVSGRVSSKTVPFRSCCCCCCCCCSCCCCCCCWWWWWWCWCWCCCVTQSFIAFKMGVAVRIWWAMACKRMWFVAMPQRSCWDVCFTRWWSGCMSIVLPNSQFLVWNNWLQSVSQP